MEGGSPMVREQQMSKTFKRRSATLNVQKSLKLLDESVASPVALGARTPGGTLRHSSYTPRQLSSTSKFDVSSRGPTPKRTPVGRRSFTSPGYQDSFLLGQTSASMAPLPEEDITEEITTTNVGLLLAEDPGISASRGLYQDFLQCLRTHTSQSDLFALVEEYQSVCREQVEMLKKLFSRASKQEEKFRKTFQVLHLLSQEEATWKLVRNLFYDRLEGSLKNEMLMDVDSSEDRHIVMGIQRDQEIADNLVKRDKTLRECQLVVDWLEGCAERDFETFSGNIKFFSDRAVGYENALHRLKNQQSGVPSGPDRGLTTELDPDAPQRQNARLDDLDKEDEDRLLQYVFACLRTGKIDTAEKICVSCGQAWRAASLQGWKLYNDPNFEGLGPECQRSPVFGNPYRDVWKKVCWNMCQCARTGVYERAVYAVLSGNLHGVLPVCKSWLDYLWAYYKIMVDQKIEDEVRLRTTVDRPLEPLPGEYWEKRLEPKTVFKEIEAVEGVTQEAFTWYPVIQKHIILEDIPGLMGVLYKWVTQERQDLPLHLIRFIAHLALFLRTSEYNTKEEYSNLIIEAYVDELIKDKQYLLIAYYVSKLPSDAQVHWYAKFLEGITDKSERQRYLDLAENCGLDLAQITKRVVENIRSKSEVDISSLAGKQTETVDTNISEEDRKKIEAIDWLVFDISQRAEAMKQANALMRMFIAMKKLVAAREVFDKLPPDSIDVIINTWYQQTGTKELLLEDKNSVREYLCMKAYLDAVESFDDWFNHYHHSKPTRPSPPEGGSFTDKVAYEHQLKLYEQEKDRWHHNLLLQTQTTKDHMYNVLLFADGGWMIDQTQPDQAPDSASDTGVEVLRQEQLEGLRRLVLPGLMFLLHTVLHTSEQYMECLKLADIVMSEQYKLYEVFRKDELQRLLTLLRESALPLLDQGRDPLGFELS